MLIIKHEKSKFNLNASRSKPRASFGVCSENSGSLYRHKDSGSIADIGGSASGMDNRSLRTDASKFESVDAQSKRRRIRGIKNEIQDWSSFSIRPGSKSRTGTAYRKVPTGFWYKSSSMGWSNIGSSSGEAFWHKDKGASGTVLASSVRLQFEKCQLFLSTSSERGCHKVSEGIKKNFRILSLKRLLFLRMKLGLLCIHGWGEAGLKREYGCVSPQIVSIIRDSTFLVGLLLSWVVSV